MTDAGSPHQRLCEAAKQLQIACDLLGDEGCLEPVELECMAHRILELATEIEACEH